MLVLVADRTTDGDGINGISDPHRQNYMPTVEDSIRIAMVDGETDIDDGGTFGEHLADAVHAGKGLNMTVVRRALFNTFRMRFRLGARADSHDCDARVFAIMSLRGSRVFSCVAILEACDPQALNARHR